MDQLNCVRCGYQASRPEFLQAGGATFAYCPSCRFYGPMADDVTTAARLFAEGDFACEIRCQDCGLDYPWTYRRTACIYGQVGRICSCARCYMKSGVWVPQPQDSLPDPAYETFLAEGMFYDEGFPADYPEEWLSDGL